MSDHLKPIVEALIFASPEPVAPKTLYKLLDGETREDVDAALAAVRADYEGPRGLQLVEVAGGFQITTRPELHEWVRKLFHDRTTQKLSVQSLETLAVIAYKQPVTAAEIAEIRGVTSSGGVLSTLVERRLIKTVGRKQVVGRPFMYATTREFLERFGLSDLGDLPKVEELSDALGFELPTALSEPTATTTSLPFEGDAPAEGLDAGDRHVELRTADDQASDDTNSDTPDSDEQATAGGQEEPSPDEQAEEEAAEEKVH
ncbi:MAG: SMC-Scp complex subunit ScpB [Vicinamibacterales bacterium]